MSDITIPEAELALRLGRLAGGVPALDAAEIDGLVRVATRANRAPAAGRARAAGGARGIRLWPRLALGFGVAAGLAVLTLVAAGVLRQPATAAAGVHFSRSHRFIVARITDPAASAAALRQAFAEHGLDIHLSLVPVSPSLVGTIVYVGENGGGIQALQGGTCVTGGGGCPVGLRIPRDYAGQAYITLGRAAQGHESYASTASVFGPGEPLHCSGLIGRRVSAAREVFAARGWMTNWTMYDSADGARLDPATLGRDYVVGAEHMARGSLLVSVSERPVSELRGNGLPGYLDRLDRVC